MRRTRATLALVDEATPAEFAAAIRPVRAVDAARALAAAAPLAEAFVNSGVGTGGAFNQFWREKDLRDLTGMCGLEGFERRRSRQFILFRVNKPL